MGEITGITWCHHTFNPWIGCMKVGPACDGCYAEAMMGEEGRYKRVVWGAPGKGAGTRSRTAPSNWSQPRKWDREAAAAGERRFVFCASLADVFDNEVPPEWRRDLFDLIRATPNLTWLLLTKRPQMIVKLFGEVISAECGEVAPAHGAWPRNAAIGCTVVTQDEADRDVPHLLAAKAALGPAFAFLSMEPLLGAVDLTNIATMRFRGAEVLNALSGELSGMFGDPAGHLPGVDWVITGGETDQGTHLSRPTHPDWFRSIRDHCAAAGVPYHHKQNGEWAACLSNDGEWPMDAPGHVRLGPGGSLTPDGWPMQKVGKKHSGRLLDGVTHDAMPVAP